MERKIHLDILKNLHDFSPLIMKIGFYYAVSLTACMYEGKSVNKTQMKVKQL
jgi:hypothetical protein